MPVPLAPLLALAGPALWMLWNLHAHGDALAFARRVAAYRAGLGVRFEGLGVYPAALAREAPLGLLGGAAAAWLCPALRRPLLGALVAVLALGAAEARGGAPTHHPERALLGPVLVALLAAAALVDRAATRRRRWALGAALWLASIGWGAFRAGPTWSALGADRGAEVALGRALGEALPPGEKALFVADSYGFFAVEAALARPGALLSRVPRSVDPRSTLDHDPLASEQALAALAASAPEAAWLLLRQGQAPWLGPRSGERALPAGARLVPLR